MKLSREKLRNLIQEAVWSVSKDRDFPANTLDQQLSPIAMWGDNRLRVYHFRFKGEELVNPVYIEDSSLTHGDLSHCIKHFIEFDSRKLVSALGRIKLSLIQSGNEIEVYQIVDNNQLVPVSYQDLQRITMSDMLNTLDRINDDIINSSGSASNLEIQLINQHLGPLLQEYNSMIDSYIENAIDVCDANTTIDSILSIFNQRGPRVIKFSATYTQYNRGGGPTVYNNYYYDLSNSGQVTEYVGLGIRSFARLIKTTNNFVQPADSIRMINPNNIKTDGYDPTQKYENLVQAIIEFKRNNPINRQNNRRR